MKKSRIIIALAILACVIMAISSCSPEHTHSFSSDWTNDAESHWHVCDGDECGEVSGKAAHSYDDGTVTTPATEEAEGVMTYKCLSCGYEKTEAIAKLDHVHTWDSEWSKDETNHWHASTCGHDDKDVALHVYDDGFIEKAATETEEGLIIYTCIHCGYEVEETIPQTSHTHTYEEGWSADETNHWHAATCEHNLIKGKEAHTFGSGVVTKDPTEYEEGITSYFCTTCNYEKQTPIDKLPHEHKFDENWSSDADSHWYASLCGHTDTEVKFSHKWDDGVITKNPTETEEGTKTFTCETCGHTKTQAIASLSHTHEFATEYSTDGSYHWFAALCGHDYVVVKALHSYDANGNCVCGVHNVCPTCGKCMTDGCNDCNDKCAFRDTNNIVLFAPNAALSTPEGPNGIAPGNAGSYNYDSYITAQFVTLEDGTPATLVSLPRGTSAHSGVSFLANTAYDSAGKAGFNCCVPQYKNQDKLIRMHFSNVGNSEITFKFSFIDYYYDKGAVTVTLKAGESKTVVFVSNYANNTVGLNHQIVFTENAAEGAALTIWGEFLAEGIDQGITVNQPANKVDYYVGDAFTSEGLILKGSSSLIANRVDSWTRVYISKNYVTNFDGKVFTAEDVGTNIPVTVTFAGFTTSYTINVVNHDDDKCDTCGKCSNQICEYPGCGEKCQGHFDAESMTVMSFNLGTNGINNVYNKANLLNKLLRELPDLLGTQEENSLWTNAIADTLGKYGYKNVIMYREGVTNSELGNEGAGIWYNSLRYDLEEWGYFWMSDTPDTSSIWSQYGAIYKRVTTWAKLTDKASGKTLVYFNTHIGYESSELWVRSAEMIMTKMHEFFNQGYPVIVTGDFNFALNTEGAPEAYAVFMNGLSDPHYNAIVKNYEEGKENTFSGYGEYQGAGTESAGDVNDRKHILPIDYMLYSAGFVAEEYTILREELPEGVTGPDRQYFSSDHFAIKTVFSFSDDWGKHSCWEPCAKCGLCLDKDCELCVDKCIGHHKCETICPDCGKCANLDGECEAEHCPAYKITLVGASFADSYSMVGCKISKEIYTDSSKTFEGFIDSNKNYYSIDDLKALEITGNVKFTALYQEDMLAYAASDKPGSKYVYEGISATHTYDNGIYMTTISIAKGVAAGKFFAGRGANDSGSMPLNWCAPANGKNVAIIYIYNHAKNPVKIQYTVDNYGDQNEEIIVTLQPGLNRIPLVFGGMQGQYGSFYSSDHRIYLLEDAAEDIVLDTYGYVYTAEYTDSITVNQLPTKAIYSLGEAFTSEGLKIRTTLTPWSHGTNVTNYKLDMAEGRVFTAEDIGVHTITVTHGDMTTTFQIEVVDADCSVGNHYNTKVNNVGNFADFEGDDAMYYYVCGLCGQKTEVKYAADKISFVPDKSIKGGHTIEYVTLDDGRIAAKLTLNSDVNAGSTLNIQPGSYPTNTNVAFPIFGDGRYVYIEMISSADMTLTWQPEFYGDRDGITLDLVAGVANGGGRLIKYDYNASHTAEDLPYEEFVVGSDIKAGTVVYITGYFYTVNEISDLTVKNPASKLSFKVGETFSASGLTLKPVAANSWFSEVVIYNYTTDLDGYVFTSDDIGAKTVTVSFGDLSITYQITVTE